MSIRRRVEALETASGAGFRVGLPALLDRGGNRFEAKPNDSEVAGLRISVGGDRVEVWRECEESLQDLEARAHAAARVQLMPSMILPYYAEFL
jgi:hypothetical protein